MKRIVCDLDDTICYPNHNFLDSISKYSMATPNIHMINKLKAWELEGHYIIIYTARRMLTHKGDIDKIIIDVGEITKEWLIKYEVPFDELIFGKPYGDIYIDDKAVNIKDIL